jgi:hypothetical protein
VRSGGLIVPERLDRWIVRFVQFLAARFDWR